MLKTAAEVIRLYNEIAIAAPDYVWSHRFMHPRMEDAPGSGRIVLEHREFVKGMPYQTEAARVTLTVTEACAELSRLKQRIRRARRKAQTAGKL